MLTLPSGSARVRCTRVAVVTGERVTRHTRAIHAGVANSARVIVETASWLGFMLAATIDLTNIKGAGIAVIAKKGAVSQAHTGLAGVPGRAGVVVVTGPLRRGVKTADLRVAAVDGAGVSDVTDNGGLRDADPSLAAVPGGAARNTVFSDSSSSAGLSDL